MTTPIEFTQLGGRLTMMWEPAPTGLFLSDEAVKIVKQMESILREQIAQEIEATMLANTTDVAENFTFDAWNTAVAQCAAIARGKK